MTTENGRHFDIEKIVKKYATVYNVTLLEEFFNKHRYTISTFMDSSVDPPQIPNDLTDIDNKQLGQLMGKYQKWMEHAYQMIGRYQAQYEIFFGRYRDLLNYLEVTYEGPATKARKHALADEEVRELGLLSDYFRALVKRLESYQKTYYFGKETVSREITRRLELKEHGG
jgi:hypothetical protein